MQTNTDWENIVRKMERLMRLKSFPVALKLLPDKADLETIPFIRRPEHKATFCQLINRVRNFDWTVGVDADDLIFPSCSSMLGLADTPPSHKDGTFRSIVWVATKEDGKNFEAAIPRIPLDRYQAVVMAPLVYKPFEPDMVLIYANPAQMMLLINSLQFSRYEAMQFYCVGESSCADAIARCYLTRKPSLSIPCYGERRYGHAQDDELVMAVPAELMAKALQGMEALYRRGVRYPISYAGAESNLDAQFPPTYKDLAKVKEQLQSGGRHLLVGLTGGIASGKSTVSKMLEEHGAAVIDFDLIARKVVEPGTPGLQQIVEYFGRQVLQEDGRLDRKALSKIVFGDLEKRKKLESFTHPPIFEEFFRELRQITANQPDAIIVVVVPLLIELNISYLFDTIAVVYISAAEQVRRLANRDGISEQEAQQILKAQLPIDEKLPFARFVVSNEEDLDKTRKEVESLWLNLRRYQAETKNTA